MNITEKDIEEYKKLALRPAFQHLGDLVRALDANDNTARIQFCLWRAFGWASSPHGPNYWLAKVDNSKASPTSFSDEDIEWIKKMYLLQSILGDQGLPEGSLLTP